MTRRASAAAIFLCAAPFAIAQEGPDRAGQQALAAIDACIPRLDSAVDVGYERISLRCPQLARSLERSDWSEWLPRGWKDPKNDLSAGSLAELRTVVARELASVSSGAHRPDVQRLHDVLAGLGPAAQQRTSLWTRFRAWLRTVVERNPKGDERSWLDRMIQRHGRSQTVIDLLTYTALGLVFVLAALIIVNELRVAGALRSRARSTHGGGVLTISKTRRLQWRDVERAPVAEKARVALELVITQLSELQRLPPAGALTVRELNRSAELDDAADRKRLQALALAAERARYAAELPTPQVVEEVLHGGRELLEKLGKPA